MWSLKKKVETGVECEGASVIVKISIADKVISKMLCVLQDDGKLLVGDITPFQKAKYFNKGYGSLMMSTLLTYVAQHQISEIYGYLSTVDSGHHERQYAFYKKHGFRIIEYPQLKGLNCGEVHKII